jgi:hypothetical protein
MRGAWCTLLMSKSYPFFISKKKKRENKRNLVMLSAAAPNPDPFSLSSLQMACRHDCSKAAV